MTKSVLIADDVPDVRFFLEALLTLDGYFEVVEQAGDGAEAVLKCRAARPDVVLLDLNMPVRNGLEVLPEIRAALPDAVIAVFSGFHEKAMGERTLDAGADAYLEKGMPGETLSRTLKELVEARARRN